MKGSKSVVTMSQRPETESGTVKIKGREGHNSKICKFNSN